ncbi:hypothetical protein FRZ67_13725 [Panacibacter ginsenosidivorans]|uniref:Uncharacterized protein n=1 Tax=Panacibacter ginsenosidivorans TaxID=1813871 RepID=A0A5B8V9Z9_9BACT|nr:hypothetical protein [Panacibacter ginsenosidivorans]QEC68307.1 hypothetical protein FRZ67_13725 [Panacibacter ginsenosidivorans]
MLAVLVIDIQFAGAQLKTTVVCPPFTVDLLEGTVSGKLDCNSTAGEVKKFFPCFTADSLNSTAAKDCGAVLYKDRDICFFTTRNYIEIRERFTGKLVPALMGASRESLFRLLGSPKIKDVNWDAYQTKFGTLVLYYNKTGKINKLQISTRSTETLQLCD